MCDIDRLENKNEILKYWELNIFYLQIKYNKKAKEHTFSALRKQIQTTSSIPEGYHQLYKGVKCNN